MAGRGPRAADRLSQPHGADRHRLRGGRRHRHGRAHPCPEAAGNDRRHLSGREQARRRRAARAGDRREIPCRRLHAARCRARRDDHRHRHLGQDPLRHLQGLRADLAGGRLSDARPGEQVASRPDHRRAGDVAQGQPGQGELPHAVAGLHAADRALQDQDRRARHRDLLPQQQRIHHQPAGRTDRVRVRGDPGCPYLRSPPAICGRWR